MIVKAVFNAEKKQFDLHTDYSVHCAFANKKCVAHTHDYIEIVYGFSGMARHTVDGTPYRLRKGDLLLIPKGCVHEMTPEPHSGYCNIMLKPTFFDRRFDEDDGLLALLELEEFRAFLPSVQKKKRFLHFSGEDQKKIEFLIRTTEGEQEREELATLPMKRSALYMLLTLVFRYMSTSPHFSMDEGLLDYICKHCNEHLTAGALAKRCFYTAEHFSRSFKRLTGQTFTQYLTECRLKKAAGLLRDTTKSVETVMGECGFTSRGTFFTQFSKEFGETPLQFQKNQKSVHI